MTDTGGLARAKLNLCLHVTGRRSDGYHLLDSLVVFPELGDRVRVAPAGETSLTVTGPFAADLPTGPENLALRAAALYPAHPVAIRLEKVLPVASGIGGGSADAAAALRAIAAATGAPLPGAADVLALGADVPVCLASRPARMRGIGEIIEPLPPLPDFWCVLVNPGVGSPTPEVFAALGHWQNPALPPLPEVFADAASLFAYLRATRNDLEAPAIGLRPVIRQCLDGIAATRGCALARMSGSGATVFGLYADEHGARAAEAALRAAEPGWWVAAAPV